jgi:TolA-binding protein
MRARTLLSVPAVGSDGSDSGPLDVRRLGLAVRGGLLLGGLLAVGPIGRATAQDNPPPRPPATERPTTDEPGATDPDAPLSSPAALNVFSQAATYQNNRAFDLAAESWQGFLSDFPEDPKAVEAQYHLGVCFLELKEFAKARDSLRKSLAGGKDFSRREDAHLNLGWAIYTLALRDRAELFAQADRVFARLLEEYPQGKYRDQAWFLRGESLYMQGKREKAAEAYQHLVEDHAESELLSNGLYALGVTFEELGRFAEAQKVYERFLQKFADNVLAAEVGMRRAETVLQQGDVAAAEQGFREVSRIAGFAQADHARYRQAYCVARQERFAEAAELFAAIVQDFPESRYQNDASMAAARAYFRAGEDEQAAQWFDRLLQTGGPTATEAAHWRARLWLKAGEAERALELVDRFSEEAQSQKHAFAENLRMDQADAMYELPDRQRRAMELYLKLARDVPDHVLAPQALYNAAFAAMELEDYPQAQQLAADFLAKHGDHRLVPDVKRIAAECQLQLGSSEDAARLFGELAGNSGDPDEAGRLQLRQAVALYAQKKYRDTLTQLTTRLDSFEVPEQRAEALFLIGVSYFHQDQFDQAQQSLQQSLEADGQWRQADEALLYLSRAHHRRGQAADAKLEIERLLRDFPESTLREQATYRLGEYCYALEEFAAAVGHYQGVIERWPDSSFAPYALYGQAWSELRQSHYREAQAAFGQVLSQFPTHALAKTALYARALARQQNGEFEDSLQDLEAYRQHDLNRRETSDAAYVQGLCLVGLKQHSKAIEVLQAVAEQDPDYGAGEKVLYELAWAYKSIDQPQSAGSTFEQLTARYPQGAFAAEAWYHLGEARYASNEFEPAIEAYVEARSRAPKQGDLSEKIHYKLGWARFQREQYDEARSAFDEQLRVAPEGELAGDGRFMQGECLYKQGQYQAALEQYALARQRSLSSEQITTLAYLHAGQAAGQLQLWQDSYDWLAEIARKYPESPLLLPIGYELAVAQQNLGNVAEAERLFGSIADRATGELSARARFMFGEVLYAQRQYFAAIREFRKVMFGFDPATDPQVGPWQAKAGFEAGQCAGILASQQRERDGRKQYIELATRFFQYVHTRHPSTDEATASVEQLKKLGVGAP